MKLKHSPSSWFGLLRHRPRHGGSDFIAPRRDWLWTLALAIIILMMGAAGLAYHFFTTQNTAFEKVDVDTTLVRYRKVDVNHFLAEMEVRAKAHATLRASHYVQPPRTPSASTTLELPKSATSSAAVEELSAL